MRGLGVASLLQQGVAGAGEHTGIPGKKQFFPTRVQTSHQEPECKMIVLLGHRMRRVKQEQ